MAKTKRPTIISIAGFDPSAGAGILADIKTAENIGVYAMGIISSLTLQTEKVFQKIQWRKTSEILNDINFLIQHYNIQYAKIGILRDIEMLDEIVSLLYQNKINIIWDPIIKSSTNKKIFNKKNLSKLNSIINRIYCITPNAEEAIVLANTKNIENAGQNLSQFCNVIIKGGHHPTKKGIDILYLHQQNKSIEFYFNSSLKIYPKHGSGCVFSTALTSYLSLNYSLKKATQLAKNYTEKFLASNTSLLGYHSI